MTRPDFRDFQGKGLQMLAHSAKGTTWKNHKYIKKEGDRYIYAPKGGSGVRRGTPPEETEIIDAEKNLSEHQKEDLKRYRQLLSERLTKKELKEGKLRKLYESITPQNKTGLGMAYYNEMSNLYLSEIERYNKDIEKYQKKIDELLGK